MSATTAGNAAPSSRARSSTRAPSTTYRCCRRQRGRPRPWRAAALDAELEREGLTVSTFPQQDSRVIPASRRLYDAVVNKTVVLPDLPELAQHAAGAISKHSRRGGGSTGPTRASRSTASRPCSWPWTGSRTGPRRSNCSGGSDATPMHRLRRPHPGRLLVPDLRTQANPRAQASIMRAAFVIGRPCTVCGHPAEHLDHITALIRGGSDHPTNLQPLCADCNLRKRDR